jgi:hypothetical protein
MLQYAFKEWAVICEALMQGRQAIILRKGGIDENGGEFGVEQTRFWLYPTYAHQQRTGITPETGPLLDAALAQQPPAGTLHLRAWAELTGIYRLRDVLPALMLSHLHCWSDETVRTRFAYKTPGLHLLVVRVYQTPQVSKIPELPSYMGCKSWVTLEKALPTEGSTPVLSDEDFHGVQKQLDMLLTPTALA